MRIAVFGASGRTGRPLVEQALAEGDEVTALVRDPAKLGITHERLRLVRGDVSDAARVDEAVQGQDAVLVALGPTPGTAPEALTEGIRHAIASMQRHGVRRIVVVSGAGIDVPGDRKRLPDRLISMLVRLLNRRDVLAKEEQYRLLAGSGLDWTLVRPPRLADGPRTGVHHADTRTLKGSSTLNRADLADFMLREAREGRYIGQAPFIGG
jgi:putative NADH-flavin reductase